MKTYIIGHRQPDLDSTVSPLAYAAFLKTLKGEQQVIAGRCDPVNHETQHIFEKFSVSIPKLIKKEEIKNEDQIILVDHNEDSQRLKGINPNQIIEIIDHHKPNLNLPHPIKIDIRPWGSTSTIIYDYYLAQNLKPELKIAKLLLSAILSDTLGLKSPTTIAKDQEAAKKLVQITKIDLKKLSFEIFKVKSNIDNLTPKQIVTNDYKIFNFGGRRTLINQIETVEQDKVLKMKIQLIKAMGEVKQEQKLNYIYNVITDILKENSQLIYLNEEDKKIAEKAFGGRGENNVLDIGSRLSRKKQIAPEIEKVLS